ncbi:MAG: hypothetical protein ACE5OO_00635 [Candidatus Bathyarchaeia archaeon]
MDALLEAKEGGNVPSSKARALLYHGMRGSLASEEGLVTLLEALAAADPQRAAAILGELDLEGVELAEAG